MRRIKNILRKNNAIYLAYRQYKASNIYRYFRWFKYKYNFSSETLLKKKFQRKLGRELDLVNPVKYNDKLQWLKLYWYDSLASLCADKYAVRPYVKDTIGEKYLNELHAVYESENDIVLDDLPERFVLKGTHGSGFNIICKDKTRLNWNEIKIELRRWLNTNYYWKSREWVYKDIKPRIICEKFMSQSNGNDLLDYRFFCFSGQPKFISVDFNIADKSKVTRRNIYDLDWNLMNAEISYPKEQSIILEKPVKLDEMIAVSKKLSSAFPHARVDLYNIDGNILFGEITFFHQSGMGKIKPESFEIEMGKWLELPEPRA